jgi:hypothetical protein
MERPSQTEFAPFYAAYIGLTRGANFMQLLEDSSEQLLRLFGQMDDERALYSYAAGKWTLKEMLQHIIDTETIFTYRALCFSRKDNTPLPGFEQDDYVLNSRANKRPLANMLEDFKNQRAFMMGMFKSFDADQLSFIGSMSGVPTSTRALAFITAGHVFHHINIIKERYL